MNTQDEIMCGCGHEIDVHLKHQGCTECTCKFKPSDIARLEIFKREDKHDIEDAVSWMLAAKRQHPKLFLPAWVSQFRDKRKSY